MDSLAGYSPWGPGESGTAEPQTPAFLLGKSHGQRSLVVPSMGHKEADTTENPPLSYKQLMEFV